MSWIMSGVRVPSDVTDDEADVSRPLSRRTCDSDVEEVPSEAVVVDLQTEVRWDVVSKLYSRSLYYILLSRPNIHAFGRNSLETQLSIVNFL